MISYRLMPVWLIAWKQGWEFLKASMFSRLPCSRKKKRKKKKTHCMGGLKWEDSHKTMIWTLTRYCTVVAGTLWNDESCRNSHYLQFGFRKIDEMIEEKVSLNWFFMMIRGGCLTFPACLSPSCAMNSVCIPYFPLSVNERLHVPVEMYTLRLPLFPSSSINTHTHIYI